MLKWWGWCQNDAQWKETEAALIQFSLWSPACCLQLYKDAPQRLEMIHWDHLLQAGVSKRSGEIDCLGERRWKRHRLSSQPAIVPLCSLPVTAAGWDDTPTDEWDVGGFVQVEVSLTRLSICPSRFQHNYKSVQASGLWKVQGGSILPPTIRGTTVWEWNSKRHWKRELAGVIMWLQRAKMWQLQRKEKDDCGANILEEEAKCVIKLSLRRNSWMKMEPVERKIFLLEGTLEQELNQISHCGFKPKHMTLKLHVVCGTIWTLVHHIFTFFFSKSLTGRISWILVQRF